MTGAEILLWAGKTGLSVSILILLVLVTRKFVANRFGARAAYLLWLAPALRLFMPELAILPAPEAAAVPAYAPIIETASWVAAPAASPVFDFTAIAASAALFIWIAVTIAWVCWNLESQSRFMRASLAASVPASPALTADANTIAREFGLKKSVRIRVHK